MGKARLFRLCLWLLSILYLQDTFAQDYAQWGLPEGAKARFGKGWVSGVTFSPDGKQLVVASSIGIWLYDTTTGTEVGLLTGHTSSVTRSHFLLMGLDSLAGVMTTWFSCGISIVARACIPF